MLGLDVVVRIQVNVPTRPSLCKEWNRICGTRGATGAAGIPQIPDFVTTYGRRMDIAELRNELMAAADPEKVPQMTAYMKGHFEFLGVTAGDRRTAAKPITSAAKKMDAHALLTMVETLWSEPEREFHYVAMDSIRAGAKKLRENDLDRVRALIERTPWWDTVDSLAVHTVGTMVTNHPQLVHEMDDWIESQHLWIARTAILHQLMYKERTDTNRLFTYCEMRMDHPDFFMRKAIGWALRQYARTDPAAVRAFVTKHEEALSGLSKREALKHLKESLLKDET